MTAKEELLCYVNADIILLDDFLSALQSIDFESFLAIGQRWNLDVRGAQISVDTRPRRDALSQLAQEHGELQPPWYCDYFVFPAKLDWKMPPFVVGRPGWDGWVVYQAKNKRMPLIDLTPSTVVVHQRHDYAHVPHGDARTFEGPEADANRSLLDNPLQSRNCLDADYVVINGRLRRAWRWRYIRQRLHRAENRSPSINALFTLLRFPYRAIRPAVSLGASVVGRIRR